ncbi:hypothetical protein GGR51DRAFT_523125 [Nemania sp. FL0031]|nr:hypothetical protein GGR51DRAFT_523125 [Nemania sp. FL0031]
MNPYTPQMTIRKLKDSCDPCSASKLRCDKQKPICTRCAGLNQLCSYSPARRAGRPRVRLDKSQPVEPRVREITVPNGMRAERSCQNGKQQAEQSLPTKISTRPILELDSEEGSDCTRIAISILKQLNTPERVHGLTSTNLTTTEACQRLLTILVCPCSEQPGVALLVASGCLSLMDMAHYSAHSQPTQGLGLDLWTNSHILENRNPCGVEDLAKVAKVISQFTDKYCQEPKCGTNWPYTNWLVAPILPLLRLRLQSITRNAARCLVV